MEFGSINLVVKDPDAALITYQKMYGANNIKEIIKLKGLSDAEETVDGYYLKMQRVSLGIFTPRNTNGKMGQFLNKYGEGIHHICLYLGQDEFEQTYAKFKTQGLPVSEKAVYYGKLGEAVFWLDESGEQGVPVKFATKAYHGLQMWQDVIYLDTPEKAEFVSARQEYLMPRVTLGTIMVTAKDWEKQKRVWTNILAKPALDFGNVNTLEKGEVNDGRGNIFVPVKYKFGGGGAINLYCALNENAPINKVMARRGRTVMYHNICSYVTRDKVHEYWEKLDAAGFAMVDPKPMLNEERGNGNYFYFVHPISTHGVLCEIVSYYTMDESNRLRYDWSDTKMNIVPPEINNTI